jgi:hypothetical protein
MRSSVLRATAFHEAGHVVAAWRQGVRVYRVTIVPTDGFMGRIDHQTVLRGNRLDLNSSDRVRGNADRRIIICLAGPEAQRRHRPCSWRAWHGRDDHTTAVDLALRMHGCEKAAATHLRRLGQRSRDLVTASWASVEAIAEALLDRGTLNQIAISAILYSRA